MNSLEIKEGELFSRHLRKAISAIAAVTLVGSSATACNAVDVANSSGSGTGGQKPEVCISHLGVINNLAGVDMVPSTSPSDENGLDYKNGEHVYCKTAVTLGLRKRFEILAAQMPGGTVENRPVKDAVLGCIYDIKKFLNACNIENCHTTNNGLGYELVRGPVGACTESTRIVIGGNSEDNFSCADFSTPNGQYYIALDAVTDMFPSSSPELEPSDGYITYYPFSNPVGGDSFWKDPKGVFCAGQESFIVPLNAISYEIQLGVDNKDSDLFFSTTGQADTWCKENFNDPNAVLAKIDAQL